MFELRRRVNGRPLLVGHRGAMGVAPENTMPAFEVGQAAGMDLLELDVQLTADGQVILFHDTLLEAKTSLPGMIKDYTAEFLQTLDVGSHFGPEFTGVTMPLLKDVLAWAKRRVGIMIELKHGPIFNPQLDHTTVGLVESFGMVDEVVFISFDQFALQRVKQLNPHLTTSLIYVGHYLNPLALVKNFLVDGLSPSSDYLTEEEVRLIHDAGYACSPGGFWSDVPTFLKWGVDTLSSNDPAALRAAVDRIQ